MHAVCVRARMRVSVLSMRIKAHTCAQTCVPTHTYNRRPGRRDKTTTRTGAEARPGTKHHTMTIQCQSRARRSAGIGQCDGAHLNGAARRDRPLARTFTHRLIVNGQNQKDSKRFPCISLLSAKRAGPAVILI